MTQHPADPLVDAVARAIFDEHFRYEPDEITTLDFKFMTLKNTYRTLAQAAPAAVREGHVVVPREMIVNAWNAWMYYSMDSSGSAELFGTLNTAMQILRLTLTQHDGAKDA